MNDLKITTYLDEQARDRVGDLKDMVIAFDNELYLYPLGRNLKPMRDSEKENIANWYDYGPYLKHCADFCFDIKPALDPAFYQFINLCGDFWRTYKPEHSEDVVIEARKTLQKHVNDRHSLSFRATQFIAYQSAHRDGKDGACFHMVSDFLEAGLDREIIQLGLQASVKRIASERRRMANTPNLDDNIVRAEYEAFLKRPEPTKATPQPETIPRLAPPNRHLRTIMDRLKRT